MSLVTQSQNTWRENLTEFQGETDTISHGGRFKIL
jgi:hypothetical protein